MRNFLTQERGNVLAIVAGSMFVIFGLGALAIDVGYILTARNQLQAAADASALAGGAGLLVSQAEATNQAIHFAAQNNCINEPVVVTANDVTFPNPARVRVQATRSLDLFFGRVLGIGTTNVTAVAVAEVASLNGVGGLKPWAIPDLDYPLGEQVILKSGELGAPGTDAGFFYPVDFPPLNQGTPITGAQQYYQNILNGSEDPIWIDDILQVEPGNQVGPTAHAINEIIAMDPNAYWDTNTNIVMDSDYPGYSSPRIVKIPFYDPDYPPDSGRNTVQVIRLGAFFLEGVSGRNVTGRFIEITSPGFWGNTTTALKGVRLVQ